MSNALCQKTYRNLRTHWPGRDTEHDSMRPYVVAMSPCRQKTLCPPILKVIDALNTVPQMLQARSS